jgi:hypothetical protein
MEYTLLSPASMYPPSALTDTTVAAWSTSGCRWSHSLCIYWDWGQLSSMLHYVFCDTLLIELSRERVIDWNSFLVRTWIKIFLVNIFLTQLLRQWLVHVVLIWLLSRHLPWSILKAMQSISKEISVTGHPMRLSVAMICTVSWQIMSHICHKTEAKRTFTSFVYLV